MKTKEQNSTNAAPRALRFVVEKLLPRSFRRVYMESLNAIVASGGRLVPESARAIIASYQIQVVAAFNRAAFVAEIGAIVFCFAAASLSLPLMIVLGAVLGALTLRDAYTHRGQGTAAEAPEDPDTEAPPASQVYLDSAGDAATAAVFLLASQAMMLKISPSMAIPSDVFFRGAFVCLPLLGTLRMVLRPEPNNGIRFQGSNMSPGEIYKTTQRLNLLWLTACSGALWTNREATPALFPAQDFFLTLLPILTFGFWLRLQQDVLPRDSHVETVFGDWKKKEDARKREALFKGVDKRDPLYRVYISMETLFFLVMALPLAAGLWPWLAGREPEVDMFRLGFNLTLLATLTLTWNHVKNSNRAAAAALQKP